MRIPICLSLATVIALMTPCWGESFSVRVINKDNGRPIPGQEVTISLEYGNEKPPPDLDLTITKQTDSGGGISFALRHPLPQSLIVQVRLAPKRWRCGCSTMVSTADLINRGYVSPGVDHGRALVKPQPGEVLIRAAPLTIFEKLLYPLMKE